MIDMLANVLHRASVISYNLDLIIAVPAEPWKGHWVMLLVVLDLEELRGPSMSCAELGRMFNFKPSSSSQCSRKGKLKIWKHTFVCLAQPEQDQTPDSMVKARLKMAGLGQKSCSVHICLVNYLEGVEEGDLISTCFEN